LGYAFISKPRDVIVEGMIEMPKVVQITRTVQRSLQRHRFINEAWVRQIILDMPMERRRYINEEEFIIQTLRRKDKKTVKVSLWVHDYGWRFLVYKVHVEPSY